MIYRLNSHKVAFHLCYVSRLQFYASRCALSIRAYSYTFPIYVCLRTSSKSIFELCRTISGHCTRGTPFNSFLQPQHPWFGNPTYRIHRRSNNINKPEIVGENFLLFGFPCRLLSRQWEICRLTFGSRWRWWVTARAASASRTSRNHNQSYVNPAQS